MRPRTVSVKVAVSQNGDGLFRAKGEVRTDDLTPFTGKNEAEMTGTTPNAAVILVLERIAVQMRSQECARPNEVDPCGHPSPCSARSASG